MKKTDNNNILPTEPFITLILIGLLLTGVTLYYKAINLQRFLEPALAVLEPSVTFTSKINKTARNKLSHATDNKIVIRGNNLSIHKSLFRSAEHKQIPLIVREMGSFIKTILNDKTLSNDIQSVIIKANVPIHAALAEPGLYDNMRLQAEAVLNTIMQLEPSLASTNAHKMGSLAMYSKNPGAAEWLTLEVVPSEMLHIKVLERMSKYTNKPQNGKPSH